MSRATVLVPTRHARPARKRNVGVVVISAKFRVDLSAIRPITEGAAASPSKWTSNPVSPRAVARASGAITSWTTAKIGPVQKLSEMPARANKAINSGR